MSATRDRPAMKPARQQQHGRSCAGRTSPFPRPSTATPITAPVVPLMPLGRSTARTRGAAFMASIMARATPSTGRSRPAPNRASMTIIGRRSRRSASRARRGRSSAGRPRGRIALEPRTVAGQQQPDAIAALGQQAGGNEAIAAIVARPGHDGDARAAGWSAATPSATARPAFSIRSMPATPPAIVRRSASAISALESSSIMSSQH